MEDPDDKLIKVEADSSYFLYVGEIKAAGLNAFLVPALSRRYGKPARCIHVVPDVLSAYPVDHYIVVNPAARQMRTEHGGPVNVRLPLQRFAEEVSADSRIHMLVEEILRGQDDLFVNMFETRPELNLPGHGRIRIIGPEPFLAEKLNSKLEQYLMMTELGIRVPEGAICDSVLDAVHFAEDLLEEDGKVFVSGEFSSAGSNSLIATTGSEVVKRFRDYRGGMLVTRFVEHDLDPTVLGIVAGPGQVYIASVADQKIDGTRFFGSTFPSVVGKEMSRDLVGITRKVGEHMAGLGYRGTFGCDYMVNGAGELYFVEINARKQGTTMETALTMMHRLPGHPTFPELELMAVTGQGFPPDIREMESHAGPLFWGTYNYKAHQDLTVRSSIDQDLTEEDLFQKAADGGFGYVVLDHVGPGVHVKKGGFLGRVIAAGNSHEEVRHALDQGVDHINRATD